MLMASDQDSVRLLAVESCSAFASALSREDGIASLLPVILKFSQVGTLAFYVPCMLGHEMHTSFKYSLHRTSLGG